MISLGLIAIILMYGLLGVWSTSVAADGQYGLFYKHLFSIVVGLSVFISIRFSGYRRLQRLTPLFYGLLILLLSAVLFLGPVVAGSRRWIFLGSFSFQPSELAKLVLTLTLSTHLSSVVLKRGHPGTNALQLFALLAHIALPCFLVLKEPDLGMTLVLLGLFFSLLVVSPFSFWILSLTLMPAVSIVLFFVNQMLWQAHLLVGAVALGAVTLSTRFYKKQQGFMLLLASIVLALNASIVWIVQGAWQHLKPYQKQRILTFISPTPDTLASGYQVQQSKIAVGSGGLTGQGLFSGSQTQLGYVPEQHTDFIFSAISEETGFLGAGFLLICFALLVFRILWIGFKAQEPQQLYICTGVAALLLMQLLINVGMNLDMMPVTGVPLPLVSYGGSSMLIQLSLLGLVESIHVKQQQEGWLTYV
jgi:rod shape determining protein RodA